MNIVYIQSLQTQNLFYIPQQMRKIKKKNQEDNGGNLITNYILTPSPKVNSSNLKHERDYHQSSMEAENGQSDTVIVNSEKDVFEEQKKITQVCYQMIMIAPYDLIGFEQICKRIRSIANNYKKGDILKFIVQNAKREKIKNIDNLQKLEDEDFWNLTMPELLDVASKVDLQQLISSNVQMLIPNTNCTVRVSKAQILITLIDMFLCIFPRQTSRKDHSIFSFGKLMQVDYDNLSKSNMKLEKLKCIINYFKVLLKRDIHRLNQQYLQFYKSVKTVKETDYRDPIYFCLRDVEIKGGFIEENYEYDILVDFANKNVGGGVLNRGCVQEEILFVVFPELIFSICICFQLTEDQSLIIIGAEKFNLYEGYSDSFQFKGTFQREKNSGPFKSIILAIDAYQFKTDQEKENLQYKSHYINREIQKFLGGINASNYEADESMKICTGKWGCGAFGGDVYLKFLIQWIACSAGQKNMVYVCQEQNQKKQIQAMYSFLKKYNTQELFDAIEEYNEYKMENREKKTLIFRQFMKQFI